MFICNVRRIAGVVFLPSHRILVIYSPDYSKVLSVTLTYDYASTNGSDKDDPCCYTVDVDR